LFRTPLTVAVRPQSSEMRECFKRKAVLLSVVFGYNDAMMEPAQKRYPISVQMYHVMAEHGAFAPDERVELIDGEIIEMSPIGSRHVRCVNFLSEFLGRHFADRYVVSVQNPIVATDNTEPQPDIALLERKPNLYIDELPTGREVALVIEVADSSAGFDRSRKVPKYAAAGIPETWLIDLESEHVEVHFSPKNTAYGIVKIYLRGEDAASETMPEFKLPVADILG
jgi:Uma2 family endonuclease